MLYQTDLDVTGDPVAYAAQYGLTAEVLDPSGPAGGWPVVRFTGRLSAVVAILEDYFGDDLDDVAVIEPVPGSDR